MAAPITPSNRPQVPVSQPAEALPKPSLKDFSTLVNKAATTTPAPGARVKLNQTGLDYTPLSVRRIFSRSVEHLSGQNALPEQAAKNAYKAFKTQAEKEYGRDTTQAVFKSLGLDKKNTLTVEDTAKALQAFKAYNHPAEATANPDLVRLTALKLPPTPLPQSLLTPISEKLNTAINTPLPSNTDTVCDDFKTDATRLTLLIDNEDISKTVDPSQRDDAAPRIAILAQTIAKQYPDDPAMASRVLWDLSHLLTQTTLNDATRALNPEDAEAVVNNSQAIGETVTFLKGMGDIMNEDSKPTFSLHPEADGTFSIEAVDLKATNTYMNLQSGKLTSLNPEESLQTLRLNIVYTPPTTSTGPSKVEILPSSFYSHHFEPVK